jgi:thioredoxin 1
VATIELTTANFQEIVTGSDTVLIYFWAEWCGPCKMFGPIFEKVSEENPDLVFGKVDTEAQQELGAAFGIMSIPTLMILREGIVLFAQPGALPEATLVDLVKQTRELDMERVRAELLSEETENERATSND